MKIARCCFHRMYIHSYICINITRLSSLRICLFHYIIKRCFNCNRQNLLICTYDLDIYDMISFATTCLPTSYWQTSGVANDIMILCYSAFPFCPLIVFPPFFPRKPPPKRNSQSCIQPVQFRVCFDFIHKCPLII